MTRIVALIPARSGSKRVVGKNVRPLAGHPVMAYTLAAARASGVFVDVVLSTDSEEYADIGRRYGAEVPFLRPATLAGDTSPDIEWVVHALRGLAAAGRTYDAFSILRPTSPFRLPTTIQRAWKQFLGHPEADSLRAVEKCKQHPGKMWVLKGALMVPLLSPRHQREILGQEQGHTPWHSSQYQSLPPVYVQNASLEIAWCRVALEGGTIAGENVVPFLTEGYEGFDVNHPYDWVFAEELVRTGQAQLPEVRA
jgi:N-acylneuraminate cytidylyltransferase